MSPEFGSTCAIFPIDAETLELPVALGAPTGADRAGRGLRHGRRACGTTRSPSSRPSPRRSSSTWRRSCPARRPQAPPGPRPADAPRRTPSARRWDGYVQSYDEPRRGLGRELSLERPAGQRQRLARRPTTAARAMSTRRPTGARHGQVARAQRAARSPTARGRARPRPRGDRRDHELHQHLQPVGDDRRRRSSRATRSRGACARRRGSRRRSRRARRSSPSTSTVPGLTEPLEDARLQPRRLRLHHLHRQLRPAARRRSPRPSATPTWRSSRCCRATATSRGASTRT